MPAPFAVDIVTDETARTGEITITGGTDGDNAALRELREGLLEMWPSLVHRGSDLKRNVPSPPPMDV